MIIAVDFDGTLCEDQYPHIGKPVEGAVKAMADLSRQGHYLIVWTCRTGERFKDAVNWLREHHIHFDRINDHCPDNVAMYGDGGLKVYADIYIDDRNLGGFPGWAKALDEIKKAQSSQVVNN